MSSDIKNNFLQGRRSFLRQASCAAVGYTTLFSTLNNLKATNAAAMANSATYLGGDYKALICILNSGGMDSYNMLIPKSDDIYNDYADTRTNLAIPQDDIIGLNPITSDGNDYGLHPSMIKTKDLFDQGKVAFLSNVGSLVEPTTKTDYEQGSTDLPLGLFSHSDQQMHWQTGLPQNRNNIGWGGKLADLIGDMNSNQNISMNISLSGNNIYQSGNNTTEYSIHRENGSLGIGGYGTTSVFNTLRSEGIDNMLDIQYQDVFRKSYLETIKNAKDSHEEFSAAIDAVTPFAEPFEDTIISNSMHMIAKTIAARDTLGMSRQIFFVNFGGWDHHDEILERQELMLTEFDNALNSFNSAMEELNTSECVTTFNISEFGRTLTSNGDGTDHAWGGNVLVMGGAVNGKDIYGMYPSLALDSAQEIGGGVLVPTTSADEYFAELAQWFGVSNTDLPIILPNVGNFYNINGSTPPIGFMNI